MTYIDGIALFIKTWKNMLFKSKKKPTYENASIFLHLLFFDFSSPLLWALLTLLVTSSTPQSERACYKLENYAIYSYDNIIR